FADAIDRFVHDGVEIFLPEQADHVVGHAQVAVFDLKDGDEAVEIFRADVGEERQLAQTIAKQREKERLLVLRAADNGDFVDKKVCRGDGKRESVFARGSPALFKQALARVYVRGVAGGVES